MWKMRLSLLRGASFRILVPIFAPPWGGVFGRLMNGFALKKQYFLHSFNENHQKPIGFLTILALGPFDFRLGVFGGSLGLLVGFSGWIFGLGSFLGGPLDAARPPSGMLLRHCGLDVGFFFIFNYDIV